MTSHDPFNGDTTSARRSFQNSEGVRAEVLLTCRNDAAPATPTPKEVQTLKALNDTGARCPSGDVCFADMNVATFDGRTNQPAPLVRAALPQMFGPSIDATSYRMKNEATGEISDAYIRLDAAGDRYYANAIMLPIPSGTKQKTLFYYRLAVIGHATPVDIVLDYTQPKFATFIRNCQTRGEQASLNGSQAAFISAARSSPKAVPSFSCSRAQNWAQAFVCTDQKIAGLDRQVAAVLNAAKSVSTDGFSLDGEQRKWLEVRDACTSAECLQLLYSARLSELVSLAKGGATSAALPIR
jgi:uncharacterized protein YecT (DUF1311 family)